MFFIFRTVGICCSSTRLICRIAPCGLTMRFIENGPGERPENGGRFLSCGRWDAAGKRRDKVGNFVPIKVRVAIHQFIRWHSANQRIASKSLILGMLNLIWLQDVTDKNGMDRASAHSM
jgi:hypothetical protein